MQGNVWEWVEDRYQHKRTDNVSEKATDTDFRVFRGGSMDDNARAQRLASRRKRSPDSRQHYLGFRLAITRK
jgi:formylglycine-generating enzyme required for sulfatase activity